MADLDNDILISAKVEGFDAYQADLNKIVSITQNTLGKIQFPNLGTMLNFASIAPPKIDFSTFNVATANLGQLENAYNQLRSDFTEGADLSMLSDLQAKIKAINSELKSASSGGGSGGGGKKPFDLATASAGELQRELTRLQREFRTGMDTTQIVALRNKLRDLKVETGQIDGRSFTQKLAAAFSESLNNATNWQQRILEIAGGNMIANLFEKIGSSVVNVGKYAINSAGQFESLKASLVVIAGGQGVGEQLFNQFQKLANTSPFNFTDVGEQGKKLLAMGIPISDVTDRLSRIGDVAAGVGREKLPSIVYAYGQIKSAGVAMAGDISQFVNAGVPIIENLAAVLGKPESEIKKLASTGKIHFSEIDAALMRMTNEGGTFFEMMKTQSNTFEGLWSSMEDSFQTLAGGIGMKLLPIAKSMVVSFSEAANGVNDFVSNSKGVDMFIDAFGAALAITMELAKNIVPLTLIVGGLTAAINAEAIAVGLNNAVTKSGVILENAAIAAKTIYTGVSTALSSALTLLTGTTEAQAAAQLAVNATINPAVTGFIALTAIIATVAGGVMLLSDNTEKATASQTAAINIQKEISDAYISERSKLDGLFAILNDCNASRELQSKAARKIITDYKDLGVAYTNENDLIGDTIEKENVRIKLQETLRIAVLDRIAATYKAEKLQMLNSQKLDNDLAKSRLEAFEKQNSKIETRVVRGEAQNVNVSAVGQMSAESYENFAKSLGIDVSFLEKYSTGNFDVLAKKLKEKDLLVSAQIEQLKSDNTFKELLKSVSETYKGVDASTLTNTKKELEASGKEAAKSTEAIGSSLQALKDKLKEVTEQQEKFTDKNSKSYLVLQDRINVIQKEIKHLEELKKLRGADANSIEVISAKLKDLQEENKRISDTSPKYAQNAAQINEYTLQIEKLNDKTKLLSLKEGSLPRLEFELELINKQLKNATDSNLITQLTVQAIEAEKRVGALKFQIFKTRFDIENPQNNLEIIPKESIKQSAISSNEIVQQTQSKIDAINLEIAKLGSNASYSLRTNLEKSIMELESYRDKTISTLNSTEFGVPLLQPSQSQPNIASIKGGALESSKANIDAINEAIGKVANTTSPFWDKMSEGAYAFTDALGATHAQSMEFGTAFTDIMKDVAKSTASSFGDIAFSFGQGIGGLMVGIGSFSEVATQALFALGEAILVQIPKIIGMGLIQAAFSPANIAAFPVSLPIMLPLFLGGLALLGLSGIASGVLGGMQSKGQAKSNLPNVAEQTSPTNVSNEVKRVNGLANLGTESTVKTTVITVNMPIYDSDKILISNYQKQLEIEDVLK